ncbi:MAG: hypothetical protein HY202_04535 [Nitrospirae bacterium]|nr:hypothetical protein [Nitrospirota bacterium]
MSKSQAYIKAGGIGALIAAICCFTPLLVVLFGVVGLGAITGFFWIYTVSILTKSQN